MLPNLRSIHHPVVPRSSRSLSQWHYRYVPDSLSDTDFVFTGLSLLKSSTNPARPCFHSALRRCCQRTPLALISPPGSKACQLIRSWKMLLCWPRPSMVGRMLPDQRLLQRWSPERSQLAVGALGVPHRLMCSLARCRDLLPPARPRPMATAPESAPQPARTSWSRHRKPMGSSTLSLPYVLPRHSSWVIEWPDPDTKGGCKKKPCWSCILRKSRLYSSVTVHSPDLRLLCSLSMSCLRSTLICHCAWTSVYLDVALGRPFICLAASDCIPVPQYVAIHASVPSRLGLSVRPSGSCVSSSLFPFWSGSATGAWPAVPAAPCCMGRAQRQRRQSARPGQQNRQLTSDSTEDLVTAPTASSAAEDESPDFSSHQLTSRERALFNFVTWSTREPPPMTIFVRPYLQSLVRSASATKEATGDDESVDTVRPPMTPPTRPDVPGGHSDRRISEDGRLLPEPKHSSGPSTAEAVRSRKRRKRSQSISSISSDFDLGSLSLSAYPSLSRGSTWPVSASPAETLYPTS